MQRFAKLLIALISVLTCLALSQPALANPPAPTISPNSGVFFSPADISGITISGTGNLYFTLDGTVPTSASNVYSSTIPFTGPVQVRAIAVSGGTSPVSTSWFDIDPTAVNQISAVPNVGPATETNLMLWVRADFGTTTSGSNVQQWGDLSGNQQIFTQATTANQPTVVSSVLNGEPVLNFNPSSSAEYLTSLQAMPAAFTSGLSIFIVTRPLVTASGAQLLFFGTNGTSSPNGFGISENSSLEPTFYINNGSTTTSLSSPTAFSTSQFQLFEVTQSGTAATLYTNGVQVKTGTMNALPSVIPATNYVGQSTTAGTAFNGQIAEIFVYNASTSNSIRSRVESYLMQKYQIPTQVPTAPIISVGNSSTTTTLVNPTLVAISAQPNTTVYYSLTGPVSTSSPVYTGPINIYYSATLNTMAVRGGLQSTVSSAAYSLNSSQYPAPSAGGPTLQINTIAPDVAIP